MIFSRHTIDRLPAMGEGAFVRVNVADWLVAVATLKATDKTAPHGCRLPGMKERSPLRH